MSVAGDKVYVTAGNAPDYQSECNVYCYTTNTDQWSVLPQPRHRCGILHMLDDKLTIFGGDDPITKEVLNRVTTYNNDTDGWYSHYPDMLNNRFKPGVVTYHNYLIVMGGQRNSDSICNSIEVMDYKVELQWKEISVCLPIPMWAIKPTINGDNITIVGYDDDEGRDDRCYQIQVQEILNQSLPSGKVPTKWKELPSAIYWDTTTVPYSNPPVTIGGRCSRYVATSGVSLHDASKNLWKRVDSLTSTRTHIGVGLLNNNAIIIVGGTGGWESIEASKKFSFTTVEIGKIVFKN